MKFFKVWYYQHLQTSGLKCFEGTCRFSFLVFVWCWMSSHIVRSTLGQFFAPLKVRVPVSTKFGENWTQGILSLPHETPNIQNYKKCLDHVSYWHRVIFKYLDDFYIYFYCTRFRTDYLFKKRLIIANDIETIIIGIYHQGSSWAEVDVFFPPVGNVIIWPNPF